MKTLVVGAGSSMGRPAATLLLQAGGAVRAMSRAPETLQDLRKLGAEVIFGDLRKSATLRKACEGVEKVFAATHAFNSKGTNNPKNVDDLGNRDLIDAAKTAGVEQFVFTSGLGVSPENPVDLFRIKYQTEQYLKSSGLRFTILRPAAFMEFWVAMLCKPVLENRKVVIFGGGRNPVNFVSVRDVARYAVLALQDKRLENKTIEIGGPANLSALDIVERFERISQIRARKQHIPVPVLSISRVLTRPFSEAIHRQMCAAIWMDTTNQEMKITENVREYGVAPTPVEEIMLELLRSEGSRN